MTPTRTPTVFAGGDRLATLSENEFNSASGPPLQIRVRRGGVATTIRVYNLPGKVVRRLWEGVLTTSPPAVSWNGLDDAGSPVATGLYVVVVEQGGDVEKLNVLAVKQ
jgi:flagellar hook assembly protein FlgD